MAVIRFRIDGVLHQVYQVPATVMIAMIARIKLLVVSTSLKNGARRMVVSKPAPPMGRKSSCVYQRCLPCSAKKW
jgi:hypothetical protein